MKDPYIGEKFTKDLNFARKLAQEITENLELL
jgi:hypothetical protein